MSESKKSKKAEQLTIEEPVVSQSTSSESFEEQSPLLNEDVIERKNEIVLEAQPENNPAVIEEKSLSTQGFGKPTLNIAPAQEEAKTESLIEPEKEAKEETVQNLIDERPIKEPVHEEQISKEEIKQENIREESETDNLPKMKGEGFPADEGPTLQGIQKKAGQSTAKWSWTLFENAGPKLQLFLTELDEAELRKHVLEDLLPPDAIAFAKNYNESLEEEFRIKEWEKELIYPPLEEMLEQAGMNASMSPGARFGLGLTVVLGARAMQTKKYRTERDELVQKLMSSYAKSKEGEIRDNENSKVNQ